ncbi:MAG: NTP transferase domain-containing protein [Bacteroidetes bacterium]|nr:NTP transferase domain-containing protein [Bacteroidota bacterium]
MKAMILAAGLGTRLKPFTDSHPKALAVVNGKTILQRNIEYLQSFGAEEIIVNVHHFADQIIQKIADNNGFGSNIFISDERAEILETGGGLFKAKWFFEDEARPFILMNVDVLTDLNLTKMIDQHKASECLATLAVSERTTSRYLLFNSNKQLCGWENIKIREKILSRTSEQLYPKAFSGIQILSPHIFPLITQRGRFSLIDVYLALSENEKIFSYDHTGGQFIDVGTPEKLVAAATIFG